MTPASRFRPPASSLISSLRWIILIAFALVAAVPPAAAERGRSGSAQRGGERNAQRGGTQRGAQRGSSRGGERSTEPQTFQGRPVVPGTIIPMRQKAKSSIIPIASTPTSQTFPIPPVDMRKAIGIGLTGPESAAFADKNLRPGDLAIVVRPEDAGLLTSGTAPSRGIILRGGDLEAAEQTINWAKENGVHDIALNLEGLPREELIARQRALCQMARLSGLRFTFGPKTSDLQSFMADIAQNADMIMVQGQRYQGGAEFGKTVSELIARLRAANPKLKVWVQVSITPPYAPQMTGEQVLEEILDVAQAADGIFVYYPPEKWEATRRVLEALRPLDTSGLVKPESVKKVDKVDVVNKD